MSLFMKFNEFSAELLFIIDINLPLQSLVVQPSTLSILETVVISFLFAAVVTDYLTTRRLKATWYLSITAKEKFDYMMYNISWIWESPTEWRDVQRYHRLK